MTVKYDPNNKQNTQEGRRPQGRGRKGRARPAENAEPLLTGEDTRELNPQQVAFLAEYLAQPNAAVASAKVGMNPAYGMKILRRPTIMAALSIARQRLVDRITVDTPRVLQELARVAFFDVRDLYAPDGRLLEPQEYDDHTAHAVQSVEVDEQYEYEGQGKHRKKINVGRTVKVKLCNKMTALHDLCEHLGLLVKNVKMSGDVNVTHSQEFDWDKIPLELRMQVLEAYHQNMEPKQISVNETTVNGGELKPVEYGLKELSNGQQNGV